ncbi:MAG: OadG family protein [Clostridia bacterium]|nr:OadG family protein [Clostridia bacterium]
MNMMMALSAELGGAFSAERWAYAGKMTLIGMLMVFSVLAILWAVLAIFKLVFAGKTPKEAKPKKEAKVAKKAPEPTGSSDDVLQAVIAAGLEAYRADQEKELVAVLTAAVSAYREAEGESGAFRVVSFRRASGRRSWNSKK